MSNIVLTLGNSTPYTLLTEWPKTVTSCTANPQMALIFKRRGCWRVYSAKACTTNCGISENEQGHINISIPQYVDTLMGWGGEYRSVGAMENKILTTKMVNGGLICCINHDRVDQLQWRNRQKLRDRKRDRRRSSATPQARTFWRKHRQLNISLEIYKLINTELIPAENRVYPCEYTIFLIFLIFWHQPNDSWKNYLFFF